MTAGADTVRLAVGRRDKSNVESGALSPLPSAAAPGRITVVTAESAVVCAAVMSAPNDASAGATAEAIAAAAVGVEEALTSAADGWAGAVSAGRNSYSLATTSVVALSAARCRLRRPPPARPSARETVHVPTKSVHAAALHAVMRVVTSPGTLMSREPVAMINSVCSEIVTTTALASAAVLAAAAAMAEPSSAAVVVVGSAMIVVFTAKASGGALGGLDGGCRGGGGFKGGGGE